ncbi:MAG TPA: alkaline phosphatase family protein [Methylomirabilota bacterium]|nr:alkaline phosphatase family protein [Methylomirabilota bacterium]
MGRYRLVVRLSSAAILVPLLFGAGPSNARAAQIPIDHVIVLMQENRSFDSYFGNLHFEGQPHALPEPRGAQNPDPTNPGGPPIHVFAKTQYCEVADLNHSWNGTHQEIDGGLMDGFTAANVDPNDPSGSRAMGNYDQADLPYYYALYNTFAMGDRYFASAPTQTFPNRLYLLAGTSFGHIRNDNFPPTPGQFSQRSVFDLLDEAHITWKVYAAEYPLAIAFLFARVRETADAAKVVRISQYFIDAGTGNLPQVAFIDPVFVAPNNVENDEHPPANVQVGEKFTSQVIGALFGSPEWGSSALFLTYDEHGGFYDHVPPPAAVPPDDIPPMLEPGDVPGAFDIYGPRVPAAVISPYSRPHFVSHVVNDHTSILRFIENRFGLPALTRRDAAANPMLEFFDFTHQSFPTPPALPDAPIFATQAQYCTTVPSNTLP